MSTTKKTDQELISEFQQGNQQSFEELISRYSNKVFSLASRLTRNAEDAEEVLQDVFVTVHRRIAGFEGEVLIFKLAVSRNCERRVYERFRKRKQDQTVPLEELAQQIHVVPALKSPEHAYVDSLSIHNEMLEALETAIRKLPDDYRPVFILRDVDGLTSREVSRILDLTVPAVKSRLHRSRLMLRRRLNRFFVEQRPQNQPDDLDIVVANGK